MEPNVQSVYSDEYTIEEITGPFLPRLAEIKGADTVLRRNYELHT